jgi:CBS domain containing-hemolysin-like protein
MSIGIDRARQIIEEGGSRGKAMTFMIEYPSELLTTILVGNNVVNIWASALVTTIAARVFENDAISISVGLTTFVILIFGEIIPKTFARTHAEKLSVFVIRVLQCFYYALYPLIRTTVWLIRAVLGENAELSDRMVTKNDIEYMVNKAEKEKSMDSKQLDLINSVLEFPTIKVKDIMIPRSKVKYISAEDSFEQIVEELRRDNHSRYPVIEGDLENTVGFLHVKDLSFISDEEKGSFSIKNYLKESFFVYEHMKIQAVFDYMNRKKVHLALVKDENGLVVGIITLEDIVEEILGEIQDEHDDEEVVVSEEYNQVDLKSGVCVDGAISLRDLYNEYDFKIPLNDNYSTLAGFILDMLGNNFPKQNHIIVWEGYSFELTRVDEFEIREVRIKDVGGEKPIVSKKDYQDSSESKESSEQSFSGSVASKG